MSISGIWLSEQLDIRLAPILAEIRSAQELMVMLDQELKRAEIFCGPLGNQWQVAAPDYAEYFASPVEAYRAAVKLMCERAAAVDDEIRRLRQLIVALYPGCDDYWADQEENQETVDAARKIYKEETEAGK